MGHKEGNHSILLNNCILIIVVNSIPLHLQLAEMSQNWFGAEGNTHLYKILGLLSPISVIPGPIPSPITAHSGHILMLSENLIFLYLLNAGKNGLSMFFFFYLV